MRGGTGAIRALPLVPRGVLRLRPNVTRCSSEARRLGQALVLGLAAHHKLCTHLDKPPRFPKCGSSTVCCHRCLTPCATGVRVAAAHTPPMPMRRRRRCGLSVCLCGWWLPYAAGVWQEAPAPTDPMHPVNAKARTGPPPITKQTCWLDWLAASPPTTTKHTFPSVRTARPICSPKDFKRRTPRMHGSASAGLASLLLAAACCAALAAGGPIRATAIGEPPRRGLGGGGMSLGCLC